MVEILRHAYVARVGNADDDGFDQRRICVHLVPNGGQSSVAGRSEREVLIRPRPGSDGTEGLSSFEDKFHRL